MHLHDLNPPILEIPKLEQWHRVQRIKPISGSIRSNGFVLPPIGLLSNRFDLVGQSTAYLADSPETALYESVFRREARSCSLENLSSRAHLVFETMQRMRFADLRGHEEPFPVLQSMRYEATQFLAQDCVQNGLDGILYASAQHPQHNCLCIFSSGIANMRKVSTTPLVDGASQRLLRAVVNAAHGSRVPILAAG
jgi:hypothetical protein